MELFAEPAGALASLLPVIVAQCAELITFISRCLEVITFDSGYETKSITIILTIQQF